MQPPSCKPIDASWPKEELAVVCHWEFTVIHYTALLQQYLTGSSCNFWIFSQRTWKEEIIIVPIYRATGKSKWDNTYEVLNKIPDTQEPISIYLLLLLLCARFYFHNFHLCVLQSSHLLSGKRWDLNWWHSKTLNNHINMRLFHFHQIQRRKQEWVPRDLLQLLRQKENKVKTSLEAQIRNYWCNHTASASTVGKEDKGLFPEADDNGENKGPKIHALGWKLKSLESPLLCVYFTILM